LPDDFFDRTGYVAVHLTVAVVVAVSAIADDYLVCEYLHDLFVGQRVEHDEQTWQ
jgi:hypothetical protein